MIEVDDEMAGEKVACPDCGDINRMPAAPVAPAATPQADRSIDAESKDRAEAAGLPPDSGPEQRVALYRPSMLRARPIVFAGISLGIIGGLIILIYYGLVKGNNLGTYGGLALAAIGLIAMGVWKVKTLTEALEITNKRSVARQGLLSKATSEVLHDNIRNIQITQSFTQRIFGVGEIGISSAGQDGLEIDMKDLPKPDKIREQIDLYRPM